jgi:hypothetical protein
VEQSHQPHVHVTFLPCPFPQGEPPERAHVPAAFSWADLSDFSPKIGQAFKGKFVAVNVEHCRAVSQIQRTNGPPSPKMAA